MDQLLSPTIGALSFLGLGAVLLVVLTVVRRQEEAQLREVGGFGELQKEIQRAAESARPIHVALGSGALSSGNAITSLAGLQALEGLVETAMAYDATPIVTVGDPTLLPMAQDTLRRAYERREALELYDPDHVRFVAPSALAYAAGANPVGAPEDGIADVTAGAFGPEVSLITDGSARRKASHWAAADSVEALGALYPATGRLAVGEELYAVGAEIAKKDRLRDSLIAEDALRVVLAAAIVGAALLALFRG